MLHYCTTRKHHYTIDALRDYAGNRLRDVVDVRVYPGFDDGPLRAGDTFILADLDRVPYPSTLGQYWRHVRGRYPDVRALNHPTRSLGRFELLHTLYHRRINAFNVHPVTDVDADLRFPVFVRVRTDHDGAKTELLNTAAELREAVDALLDRYAMHQLMIIEFCDTADADGVYRKYGAYLISEELIPHHVQFSRQWMVKGADLKDEAFAREEQDYVRAPLADADRIREVFRLAGIQYGRIDFSRVDGALQVWEINTNPMMVSPTEVTGLELELQDYVLPRVIDALRRLDGRGPA